MSLTQQTATVIDFNSYRVRRNRPAATIPDGSTPGAWMFAVPVMIPMVVAWLPVWGLMGTALADGAGDE